MGAISPENINLNRYKCAKCERIPKKADEVFKGCTCGHRLWKIIHFEKKFPSFPLENKIPDKGSKIDFLTIKEHEVGIYEINVENMLNRSFNNNHSKQPLIAGNEGIYSILLENKKKK